MSKSREVMRSETGSGFSMDWIRIRGLVTQEVRKPKSLKIGYGVIAAMRDKLLESRM